MAPELQLSEHELLQATVTRSPTALTVIDISGRVLIWNPAAERLFGYSAAEVVGGEVPIVGEEGRRQSQRILRAVKQGKDILGLDAIRRHKDGHPINVAISTVALHDSRGKVAALIGAYEDLTARRAAEAELIHQAQVDELTGLHNRNGLLELLRQSRPSHRSQLAVIALDLDHFKQVNDALGHPLGDRVLSAFAERLRNSVRPGDAVARLEGALFAVLMSAVDPGAVESVVERLVRSVTQAYLVEGHEVELRVTAGVALQYRRESPAEVVRRSSVALHYAKQVSRGGFQVLDDALDHAFQERVALSTGLRGAAQRGELRLHYQPIVSATTGLSVGVEGLVRWLHPTRGLLAPSQFISIAEETGSISQIGRWVLHQACVTLRQWSDAEAAAADIGMAVNLSVPQLQDRELVEDVRAALQHSGLDPERLRLEVTESVLITDPASAARALGQLRELGVTLAIDDFGTGNSSLTALQRLPFQVLKIDRSFVNGIGIRQADTTIVGATLALAHGLGLRVVAEGVERPDQADFLIKEGCEELQGYLLGRPEPAGLTLRLLRRRHPYQLMGHPSKRAKAPSRVPEPAPGATRLASSP